MIYYSYHYTVDFDVEVLQLSSGCRDVEGSHLITLNHVKTVTASRGLAGINHVDVEW